MGDHHHLKKVKKGENQRHQRKDRNVRGPLKRKFQSRSFTRFVGFLFLRRTTFGVDVGSPTRRLCRHRRRRCSDVRFVLLWRRRLRVCKENGKTFQKSYKWLQGLSKWYYNYNCLNYYPRWHVDQDFLNCKKTNPSWVAHHSTFGRKYKRAWRSLPNPQRGFPQA